MKKTLLTISVAVLLVLSVPLSAFALSMDVYLNPTFFTLEENKITYNGKDWLDPSHSNFTFDTTNSNLGRLVFSTYADQSIPGSNTLQYWRAKFKPTSDFPSSFNTTPYMQLSISLYYTQNVSPSYSPQYINGAFYFTVPNGTADGVTYEFPIVDQITLETPEGQFLGYYLQFKGVMDISRGFNLKDCTYEFVCSGVTNATAVDLQFRDFKFVMLENISEDTVKVVESFDKGFSDLKDALDKNTQDIIDNNNTNTDKITQNQDENTDKIINSDLGYETPEEQQNNLNVIETLTSQVNVLNTNLETVKKDIDDGAENFISSAEDFGDFINQFFNMLPTALVALIFGLIIFLVLRKVVGR